MKRFLMGVVFLAGFAFSGCASYFGEGWNGQDTAFQTIYTGLHVVDWMQTREIVRKGLHETNPILGDYPSMQRVDWLIGGGLILQTIIPPMLKPEIRKWYQWGWIMVEGGAVERNYRAGIRVGF